MKRVYPIILIPEAQGFTVFVPDFEINTQGDDLAEAITMARDAMGTMGIDLEDDGKELPLASDIKMISAKEGEVISLVDVDFTDYRRKHEMKVVKKNCTVPSWLCYEAEKANINFSQVLQNALKHELHIEDR